MDHDKIAGQCWFLTGATAVGKTEVGLALARLVDAEIISLDSMAIYRGMDIGTAKPSPTEQAQVPHHLIDIVAPHEEYSIDLYLKAAAEKISEIEGRGRQVLFVGGTPLYLKALLRGLETGPPADWELREEIEKEVAEIGSQALYERLQQVDPLAASQIHPNDTRRLIRALEVFRSTGQPISHNQLHFEEGRPADACKVFVLRRTREEQHERINQRVEQMIERGLIDEVQRLTSQPSGLGRTASQAVGYREAQDFLAGNCDREQMIADVKTRTRRFAKRQGTWFRSFSECQFVDVGTEAESEDLAEQITQLRA